MGKSSPVIEKHRHCLELLSKKSVNPKIKKAILGHCSNDLLCCITSVFWNLLRGVVPLNKSQFRQLKSYRKFVHSIGDPHVPAARKRKQLLRGGSKVTKELLPLVLGIILMGEHGRMKKLKMSSILK